MRQRYAPVEDLGKWLREVVPGHLNYYAVPGNIYPLAKFCTQVNGMWLRALR